MTSRVKLLDCTLRDGGYINDWRFGENLVNNIITTLISTNIDLIEVGYISDRAEQIPGRVIFRSINEIETVLPKNKPYTKFVVMVDVNQFNPETLPDADQTDGYISGLRVVFYKRDIEKAYNFCSIVKERGYNLFVQPMVTIDYSKFEYLELVKRFLVLEPNTISIVDSFGMMSPSDFNLFYQILDDHLGASTSIGYHAHNNLEGATALARSVLQRTHKREIILDGSVLGMGRGAGNLRTEIAMHLYNEIYGDKYLLHNLISHIYDDLSAIQQHSPWGPNIFYFLTASRGYHPNYAGYLLPLYPNLTIEEFIYFLDRVPSDLKSVCKKDYVIEKFRESVSD